MTYLVSLRQNFTRNHFTDICDLYDMKPQLPTTTEPEYNDINFMMFCSGEVGITWSSMQQWRQQCWAPPVSCAFFFNETWVRHIAQDEQKNAVSASVTSTAVMTTPGEKVPAAPGTGGNKNPQPPLASHAWIQTSIFGYSEGPTTKSV